MELSSSVFDVDSFFGKVRYWRTCLHQTHGKGGGYYPVDDTLGLTADGFSCGLLGRVVEFATKMSYAAAAATVKSFLGWSPHELPRVQGSRPRTR